MSDTKFTKDHEWVRLEGGIATVGITDHAPNALGDVVFVDLPEVGREVTAGESIAVVESVKAASDVYAPIAGKIVEVNSGLGDNPGTINTAPTTD
ncbi:MAG TPA: glycine cleavage system protein GcvH, partial [Roseomonas sp.]|nr:glycine cleavage system protein GcvH [Roseomonas sp.]